MQDWPDANSWIANPETLLTDLVRLSDAFDEVMMRGPSTSRTFDMGQVEMNWATFVATARTFSRRLRAAQTRVDFPVDAIAIIRVADIVDELNYGPQRWQTSTDGPDREHTTMEFKELYFEPYVMCHHILADAISTFREYLSLNEMANPETPVKDKPPLDDEATPAKTEDGLETQREKDVRAAFKASLGLIVSDANRTVHRQGQKYSSVLPVKLSPASWELMQQLIAGGTTGVTRKFLATEFKISEPAVSQRKITLKKDLFALDITIPGDEFRLESSC